MENQRPHQAFDLIEGFVAGTLDESQQAQLVDLLRSDQCVRQLYLEYTDLHTALHSTLGSSLPSRADLSSHHERDGMLQPSALAFNSENGSWATPRHAFVGQSAASIGRWYSRHAVWSAFAGGFALGAVLFIQAARTGFFVAAPLKDSASLVADSSSSGPPNYRARLVNLTNCRWDSARTTADLSGGSNLGPGQSLHLLEGVAEITSSLPNGSTADFQLEGPIALMLTSEGMPSLQQGKLAAQIICDFDRFMMDTPLGRIVVSHDASLGVVSDVNQVDLHIFEGEAGFEPSWPLDVDQAAEQLRASAGESIRFTVSPHEEMKIQYGKANGNLFVSRVSMAASHLDIFENYVNAIRKANPTAYWRFENNENDHVRNEMGNRFPLRINGNGIRWHSYEGNRTAEFGSTSDTNYLVTDDVLDGALSKRYSMEAWIKPSHYHHGAVFSLAKWSPSEPPTTRYGMLVELCGGPIAQSVKSARSWERHPGRIRFLHRNPPANTPGTSCFSADAYALRKWQHVAAVKDDASLRLYVNGEIVAEAKDSSELGSGEHVLIGQLIPPSASPEFPIRPFIGELDEVALYGRALSQDEVRQHYRLAESTGTAP